MPSRILVLSASVGAGHVRAAEAVELALGQVAPKGTSVRHLDVLQLATATFRRVYSRAYLDLVTKAPHVLGYLYDTLDRPSRSGRGARFRLALEKLNLRQLAETLDDEMPDLVVSTHFLPAEIVASLRKKGRLDVRQAIVTTDFDVHRMWVNQPCERYFTATELGVVALTAWGVAGDTVSATGIPIHPAFCQPKEAQGCREKHDLSSGRPVVLQLSGGFGVGSVERVHDAILAAQHPMEIVAVAGRNEKARAALQAMDVPRRHRRHVLGFTEHIDELMAAADLVVSKPGGLTSSECLARGAPLLIVEPIPGQESRNSDYLLENGAAIKANSLPALTHALDRLLADPERLLSLQGAARRLGKPRAAFDVARHAVALLGS
jgi:processive 1,2-diacylglycerol beta-glucosyltransferase